MWLDLQRWRHGAPLALAIAALGKPAAADPLDLALGARLFDRQWIAAPSSTRSNDGLGPLYTASSCAACHPAAQASPLRVVRLSRGTEGDPMYGHQLQPFGMKGLKGEGEATITPTGGQPAVALTALSYGPLDLQTRIGLRRVPDLHGIGAIDALADDAILAHAAGETGGRVNRLPDGRIGRFGWKAGTASLAAQVALAFKLDLGLSTPLNLDAYGDCTSLQRDCRTAPSGAPAGEPEIADALFGRIVAFVRQLPTPPRKSDARGEAVFGSLGCAACHVPSLIDQQGHRADVFSDLLLHKMGDSLDDGVGEPGVQSNEWRTAPLLGLGHLLAAGGRLLHDGRAATIADAILAHGGEASASREAFANATNEERATLEHFLKGL